MQDLVIGRHCYTKSTTLSSSAEIRIPANPDRVSFTGVAGEGAGKYIMVSDRSRDSITRAGIVTVGWSFDNLSSSFPAFQYIVHVKDMGQFVTGELYVYMQGNAGYLIETIMMPELADAVRRETARVLGGHK